MDSSDDEACLAEEQRVSIASLLLPIVTEILVQDQADQQHKPRQGNAGKTSKDVA
jgi:hypothetical protein